MYVKNGPLWCCNIDRVGVCVHVGRKGVWNAVPSPFCFKAEIALKIKSIFKKEFQGISWSQETSHPSTISLAAIWL